MRAIVHPGFLKKLYEDYKEKVDIYMVYLMEAHAAGETQELGPHYSFFKEHKVLEDRINAAKLLMEMDSEYETFTSDMKDDTKVRMVLDSMDNSFFRVFAAMPDRVVVIEEGKLSFLGNTIEEQLVKGMLMTEELRYWIAERFDGRNIN
ncbi:type I iodothyronine deiodinase-like isoform X2 [Ptychodera flava]|uniref:type I iodothyronine deiodinase-like isoform X2 n=1 Tax=Ptychodera flava TaxID=63121 RepID=UPI00396A5D9D